MDKADMKRSTIELDDQDLTALETIMRRFGFRQEAVAIRYAIRVVAMAEHLNLKMPDTPAKKE